LNASDVTAGATAAQSPRGTALITARGIVNRFGKQVVHDGLDMEVREGEVFGVVGGSGSGKTVLLHTILGLHRPNAGQVTLHGRDITALTETELKTVKRGYGVTFQHGALFSSLTVRQNVQLPMVEFFDLPDAVLDELAGLKLRMVGLSPEAGAKYPAQLSGGMIKRAALARALALDPKLLFLDEPTAGLDPIGAAAFDELLLTLQKNLQLTVVMITHDLDTIFRTCNRVGVIVDRRMVSDTLEGIMRNDHQWIHEYFHGPRARLAHGAG
jgi:phospholipid/cholesterol/gamma-HCH transport system ATP-binding protein